MSGIIIYNKTGERFRDEGEYNDYPHQPASILSNPFYVAATSPVAIPLVGSAYASAETLNKVYGFPSDATQTSYDARKPIDCGSMKILVNNISHLVYQKCRTIAVATGPYQIGYTGSDLNATVTLSATVYPLVSSDIGRPAPVVSPPAGSIAERQQRITAYASIGWSIYSSRRMGPIPMIVDRKVEYNNQVQQAGVVYNDPALANNSFLPRKMLLCVEGTCPADEPIDFYVCVTTDGNSPRLSTTRTISLDASECAWFEYFEAGTDNLLQSGFKSLAGVVGGTLPPTLPTDYLDSIGLQTSPSYPFFGSIGDPVPGDAYRYRVFIPVNCTTEIIIDNASALGTDYLEAYVHLGWKAEVSTATVRSICLLEVRDPGSSII